MSGERRGWLERNAIALASLLILIPVGAIVMGGQEWISYYGYRPVAPIEIAPGETTEFGGAVFGPARLSDRSAEWRDSVPPGAKLLVAEVHVEPGESGPACDVELREADGARRHWDRPSFTTLDWSGQDFCFSDVTEPFDLETPFFVPEDADGPFFVEIQVADELPRFLRFRVE